MAWPHGGWEEGGGGESGDNFEVGTDAILNWGRGLSIIFPSNCNVGHGGGGAP